MKPKSKKSDQIVKCDNRHETLIVFNHVWGMNRKEMSHWNYVEIKNNETNIQEYIENCDRTLTVISFEEWENLPDSEFTLSEKWCIKYNGEPEIEQYVLSKQDFNHDYEVKVNEWVISEPGVDGSYQEWCEPDVPNGYTEINFNQFKEHVLVNKVELKTGMPFESIQPSIEAWEEFSDISNNIKVEQNDEILGSLIEAKKIIGYRLIKPEYKEACNSIAGNFIDSNFYLENLTGPESIPKEKLSKSGVLDLWFEPVYELSTEEKIIKFLAKKGITIGNLDAEDIVKLVNEK